MIDEIFACPVRKYNISDSEISKWANSLYDKQKFNMPSPFKLNFTNMEAWITQQYTDVLEEFVKGVGLGDTHVGIITDSILCVLEKGETLEGPIIQFRVTGSEGNTHPVVVYLNNVRI